MNNIKIKNSIKNQLDKYIEALTCQLTNNYIVQQNRLSSDISAECKQRITAKLNEKLNHFINILKQSIIVSGGCITSMFLNEEVNDFDIYFTDKQIVGQLREYYIKLFNAHNETHWQWNDEEKKFCFEGKKQDSIISKNITDNKFKFIPICITENAISLTDKIQIITRFTGTASEIISNFDYVHTNNYYSYEENKLCTNKKSIESILSKQLIYTGSKYPICSIIRSRKFIKRGWNISAGEYLKMALQISKLDLSDINILREQLIGVDAIYFIKFIEKLPTINRDNFIEIFKLIDEVFEEVGE